MLTDKRLLRADMHTHSDFSADCHTPMEEICRAELAVGTTVMANTDHCDIFRCSYMDVLSPLLAAREEVFRLREVYGDRLTVLSGVEIGEGFWFPETARLVERAAEWDVIIGSVHVVKYKGFIEPTAQYRFADFSDEDAEGYVDAYFDDMMTMLESRDIDVLAHLTYPWRYVEGFGGKSLDKARFDERIDRVLERVIRRGIALEVNTAYYDMMRGTTPNAEILSRYRVMGGRLITLGSDAHFGKNASLCFDEALSMLDALGFQKVYYYQNRKPIACPIKQ